MPRPRARPSTKIRRTSAVSAFSRCRPPQPIARPSRQAMSQTPLGGASSFELTALGTGWLPAGIARCDVGEERVLHRT